MTKILISLLASLTLLPVSFAQDEQSDSQTSQESQLESVFDDDFRSDTRSDYKIEGDINWEPGNLTLAEGASIVRSIPFSKWARFAIELNDSSVTTGPNAELSIRFFFEGDKNCRVRIKRQRNSDDSQFSISIFRSHSSDGRAAENLVRETTVEIQHLSKLVIEYRYGLIQFSVANRHWLAADVEYGDAPIQSLGISLAQSSIQFKHLSVSANRLESPALTDAEKRELDQAKIAHRKMIRLLQQSQYSKAIESGEEALQILKRILGEKHLDYASTLDNLGIAYDSLGEYENAESMTLKALEIRKQIVGEAHPLYAYSLNNLAIHYDDIGEYSSAEKSYLAALKIRERVLGDEHPSYALSMNNLGAFYRSRGKFEQAKIHYEKAFEIRKKVLGENHPQYADSLNSLFALYYSMGDFKNAKPFAERAAKTRKKLLGDQHINYAESLAQLAALYHSFGDYPRSRVLQEQSSEIVKDVLGEEHPIYAKCLQNLGGLFQMTGDYVRAEKSLIQAKEIIRKKLGENHRSYAEILNNLSTIYERLGDDPQAESLLLEALRIQQQTLGRNHPSTAYSLNNLAIHYDNSKQYSQAEKRYIEAIGIIKSNFGENHIRYATMLNNLAGHYKSKKKYREAEALHLQALDIKKQNLSTDHPEYGNVVNNLGILYQETGDYEKANELLIQAEEIVKKNYGDSHPEVATNLANRVKLLWSRNEYARAQPLIQQSVMVSVNAARGVIPAISDSKSMRWIKRHRPRVGSLLSTLRQLDSESSSPYDYVWKTKALATRLNSRPFLSSGATPEARQVADELRNARLKLARLISASPKPGQSEQFQREFSDANETKERLEQKLSELNPLTKRQLAARDCRIEDLIKLLPQGFAVIDIILTNDWRPFEQQITIAREDGSDELRTVVNFRPTPVYDAFVLRNEPNSSTDQIAWIDLGDAEPIDLAVGQWRGKFTEFEETRGLGNKSKRVSRDDTSPEESLSQLVWQKIAPSLGGCDTIVVLPDGQLNRVPWAALPGKVDGTYLIEDYSIATASYGQQLVGLLSSQLPEGNRLLVAGGIDYGQRSEPVSNRRKKLLAGNRRLPELRGGSVGWTFLNGANEEVDIIRHSWADHGAVATLSGSFANEAALANELTNSRYAHLATHGFFAAANFRTVSQIDLRQQALFDTATMSPTNGGTVASRNPLLLSGLVVSGANLTPEMDELGIPTGEDGILTGEEIVDLNLSNLELVTLSACETGLGDVAAGEGVFGLQRAFHQAGARSVIASLWKVDDQATQALMVEFYKNLWNKKMSKVEALRQAQLTMLNSYDKETPSLRGFGDKSVPVTGKNKNSGERLNPRYWAAFQLSGDWR